MQPFKIILSKNKLGYGKCSHIHCFVKKKKAGFKKVHRHSYKGMRMYLYKCALKISLEINMLTFQQQYSSEW